MVRENSGVGRIGGRVRGAGCALVVALVAACTPGSNKAQYAIPDNKNACTGVDLTDGQINGDPEFLALFDCLNDDGALQDLAPMVQDLDATTNPQTGKPYLDDLVSVTNGVLADPHLIDLAKVAKDLVQQQSVGDVLPVASTLIDSGLAEQLLPVTKQAIDSGAVAQSLPAVSALLKYPQMPVLLASVKGLVDDGIQNGWAAQGLQDTATLLATTDANGDPALRKALPPLNAFLSSGQAGNLVPVTDNLLDSGTVDQLLVVVRSLSDQGTLAELGPDLRPLMVQDASGHSQLQGTLDILDASNGPLKCFGITIVDNLAQTILSTMADRTPSDIQNLVSILQATIGLGDLVCDIPQSVQDNLDALDALAKSGALDGMLPILKVFKQQNQIPVLTDLLDSLHDSGALPALEPMLIAAIDAGILDHVSSTIPHLVNPDGTASEKLQAVLAAVNNLVSPTDPSDPSSAPAIGLMPLLGNAAGAQTDALADALFLLGQTMQDPGSGFADVLPAVSAALGADPNGQVLQAIAQRIDDGTVAGSLPMTSHMIESGSVEALLPYLSQMIHDGTAEDLLQMLGATFDLMDTGS